MPDQTTDLALIERVIAGNQSAFAELVKQYQRYVFTVALNFVKKREDAEQTRLTNKEAALRKQFTALDTQISKLNSLSSYLTQQLTQIANLTSSN